MRPPKHNSASRPAQLSDSEPLRSVASRGTGNRAAICTAFILGIGPSPASFAHHSFAMYDQTRRITLSGIVTEWQWTNPHSELFVILGPQDGANNADDKVWRLEGESPEVLRKNFELRRDSIHVGDKITVMINPLRDGSPGGRLLGLTLLDGSSHGSLAQ